MEVEDKLGKESINKFQRYLVHLLRNLFLCPRSRSFISHLAFLLHVSLYFLLKSYALTRVSQCRLLRPWIHPRYEER